MPLTDNEFTGLVADGNWNTAGNWSLGHKPTATERAVIDALNNGDQYPTSNTGTASSIGGLLISDTESGNLDLSLITVLGLAALGNGAVVDLTLADAATFTGGVDGNLTITHLTGIVAVSNASGDMTISGGNGTINLDSTPAVTVSSTFTGTIHVANAIAGNLGGSTINATATLTATGTGTISNFTWLSPNAGATMTGSTTVVQGATISGTYDGRFGFNPAACVLSGVDFLDNFVASGGTSSSETWSASLTISSGSASAGTYQISLIDGVPTIINFPDITIIAPSTGGSAAITQQQQLIRRHHHHAS